MVRLINEARKVNYINSDKGNDDLTILDPLQSILGVGQDYKTGVQVGRTFPIYETERHSNRAIVLTGESVGCGEHDSSSENITPSATLQMNLTEMLGESLFSGGKYGNGQIYVSVNDDTMDRSTGIKHVANI